MWVFVCFSFILEGGNLRFSWVLSTLLGVRNSSFVNAIRVCTFPSFTETPNANNYLFFSGIRYVIFLVEAKDSKPDV